MEALREILIELFMEARNGQTPKRVEGIVADIGEIVQALRFFGWQSTSAGKREVQKALRRTLLKYKLHRGQDLFERAYGHIRRYC